MNDNRIVKTWATAVSTNATNDRKIIFRFVETFSPVFEPVSQPDRVILVWKYQSDTGQPLSEEHQRMNLMEDSLEPLLTPEGFATLALVSTGENLREWTFYTKSSDEFINRVNELLAGMPWFPIEVHAAKDSAWKMYRDFLSGIKNADVTKH